MSESDDSDDDDFIARAQAADAREAARRRAIDPPNGAQKPRTATNGSLRKAYAQKGLANETEALKSLAGTTGTRQTTLNTVAFNVGTLVQPGGLTFGEAERTLTDAALYIGLTRDELRQWRLPERGLRDGMKSPRNLDEKERAATSLVRPNKPTTQQGDAKSDDWSEADPDEERRITVQSLASVKTRVPLWVWEYEQVGRIQLGTLCLFAGKPGAGKSTATRWFASRISDGTLPGVWYGNPMRVAVYSPEEQLDDTIAPSLQAHDANLSNVLSLSAFEAGIDDGILSVRDEGRLTETLLANNIRALFIDPVIGTFDTKVADPNKTSDVRRHLMPYVRIAKAINGIVIGVTHLRKGNVVDVMTNINGSSAFGEIPRAVFGFASVGDGMNVVEQVKNSAGQNGLKLEYRLPIERGLADDGQTYELPRFEIKGSTELSITDIGGNDTEEDATTSSADTVWLERYLQIEQPAPSSEVYRIAEKQAGMTRYRVTKARRKLKVRIINKPRPDAPHTTAWCLPDYSG